MWDRARKPTAVLLLGIGVAGVVALLMIGYALSWPGRRGGLLLAGGWAGAAAGIGTLVGVLAWGKRRWRATLGTVGGISGLVAVTVSLTLPLVMRSGEWRAAGGPQFRLGAMLGFLVVSAAVALAGFALAASAEDREPWLRQVREPGPAPIDAAPTDRARAYRLQ